MSSSTVSQLLQVTAPPPEAKSTPSNSSSERQFQDLLVRASNTAEGESKQTAESTPVQTADKTLTNNAGQDTSQQSENSSPDPDSPLENHSDSSKDSIELSTEMVTDVIELSETVELVVAAQAAALENHSSEGTEQTVEVAAVIDAPEISATNGQPEIPVETSVEQFANSFEVNLPASHIVVPVEEQPDAAELDVVVETESSAPEEFPGSAKHELIIDSAGQRLPSASGEEPLVETTHNLSHTTSQPTSNNVVEQTPLAAGLSPATVDRSTTTGAPATVGKFAKRATQSDAFEVPTETTTDKRGGDQKPVLPQSESGAIHEEALGINKEIIAESSNTGSAQPTESASANINAANPRSASEAPAANSATSEPGLEQDPVPTADRARFVQRVGRALQAAQSRDGQIQLRLSPPELGSLRISISVQEGLISAKLETETVAARNILLDNLPALRERLAEQEIRIEKFDVDVPRDGGHEAGSSGTEDPQARRSPTNSGQSLPERESVAAETSSTGPSTTINGPVADGGLDVRI